MSSVPEEALQKIEKAKAKAAKAAEEAAKKANTAELEKFWKSVSMMTFTEGNLDFNWLVLGAGGPSRLH